jgi:predicted HicB family RNase H-like nuclease
VAKFAKAPRQRRSAGTKDKAAFTLRLDTDRHLKLRLAAAVTGTSAQQLVTKALDLLLGSMPEVDAMAQRAPERAPSKR